MFENINFKNVDEKTKTQIIINNFISSRKVNELRSAENYFDNHNETIEKKSRVYYDKDRNPHDNPSANNAKVKSNFLRMLVQQKQDYGFAKTFIAKLSDGEENEIDLTENEYGKAWKKFIKENLYSLSYVLAGQAVNYGMAWCYVWIDDNGNLKIKDVSPLSVCPLWGNSQHTELKNLVYHYFVETYYSLNPTREEFAEYWDNDKRVLFNISDAYRQVAQLQNSRGEEIDSHLIDGDIGVSWGRIPFIGLKGTPDEKPLLNFIREQIDAYDELDSLSIDGLVDDLNPIMVLKGISPEVGTLIEARELAKMTRTISIDSDGDAGYIQAQTSIEAYQTKMENLRRDIIKFGYGVDYENASFSGNPNQMVIKSLFQNLDTYTDGLERHFQDFMDNLKYFFDKWYEFTHKGSFEECQKYKILVKLDRSMMINQSSMIEDTVKLAGTNISQRTLLEFNPVVQDVDLELERLEEEKKENEENSLFNFQSPANEENEENEPEENEE